MKIAFVTTILTFLQLSGCCIGLEKPIAGKSLRRSGETISPGTERILKAGTAGIFLLKEIQYEDPNILDDREGPIWNVELEDGQILELKNLDPSWIAENGDDLVSGVTELVLPAGAIVDGTLDLLGAVPRVLNGLLGGLFHRRKLAEVTGDKSILVVRVVANDGATSFSETELSNSVFGNGVDPVNLKSQYEACSYDKLSVNKAENRNRNGNIITNGATTVTVAVSRYQGDNVMRNAISSQLNAMFGVSSPAELADHVMYCLPRGTMNGAAYAFVNSWNSVYNNEWCTYVSAQVHEIGHNLNLAHSNEGGRTYEDQSGMMGFSYSDDDGPLMCFNAAKSWQLGWYSDRHLTFSTNDNFWSGKLFGIADYGSTTTTDGPVVIKINRDGAMDIYVSFNRRSGINAGTQEGGNTVTIVEQGGEGAAFAESSLAAKLNAGNSRTYRNFSGSGKDLTITVTSIVTNTSPAYAGIDVCLGQCGGCSSDSDCSDQDACNQGFCGVDRQCQIRQVSGCNACTQDSECNDQDLCNVGFCNVDGRCAIREIEGCCLSDLDCNDRSSCTEDICLFNSCANPRKDGCSSLACLFGRC